MSIQNMNNTKYRKKKNHVDAYNITHLPYTFLNDYNKKYFIARFLITCIFTTNN